LSPGALASAVRGRRSDGSAPYVYAPREDTALLVRAAARCQGATVLEVGAGSGAAAFAAVRAGARSVVATDLNPHALRAIRQMARADGLPVEVVRTDLARGLGRFERVLANPPYLPTTAVERDPNRWADLALNGGPGGTETLARLLGTLPRHLAATGRAYVVVSTVQSSARLVRLRARWRARGGTVRVVDRRQLEGERLVLWELRRRATSRGARRSRRPAPRTPSHPRSRRSNRSGSNRGPGPGRTTARGGASGRRRSRPGS